MDTKNYDGAHDSITLATVLIQSQLKTATAYEGILILQMLKQLRETQTMIESMIDAANEIRG